jgi:hypothetical protein
MEEQSAVKSEANVVFDATRPVAVNLRTPDGVKTVRVRFPSDQEWTERQRRRKVLIKQLGRGTSETSVPNSEEVDAALLAKVRTEEEPAVDAFEATRVLDHLALADVDDVAPAGGAYRVALRVLGGTTAHLLRVPSAKQITEYRRGFVRVLDLPFNRQELTVNLAAAASLYEALVTATEGYAGAAPIIHKAAVVKAAIDALEAAFEEDRGENFP